MNNIQPRTREEREALKSKESIEKSRINQRVGLEARNVDIKQLIHSPDPKSDLFVPENERFNKDFASYDKMKRLEQKQKQDLIMEKHKIANLERDAIRWERMEEQEKRQAAKQEFKKNVLLQGKRNMNGLPYNPITLEYHNNEGGVNLMNRDEQSKVNRLTTMIITSKVRQYLRATNIDARSNCGYDLLTGESRKEVIIPENLQEKYKNVIDKAYQESGIKNYSTASNRNQ